MHRRFPSTASPSPVRVSLSVLVLTSLLGLPLTNAQVPRMITVPALVVTEAGASPQGAVNYFVVQLETDQTGRGPTLIFNELSTPWSGSSVGATLKEGVRQAVRAATQALGDEGRQWRITVKNFSQNRFSDGSSASSAVAVGIMAAVRGDSLNDHVAVTGVVSASGAISRVGGLVQKLEAAAQAGMTTILVPRGQAQTAEWDLFALGHQRGLAVIEVDSLGEAYAYMTGHRP